MDDEVAEEKQLPSLMPRWKRGLAKADEKVVVKNVVAKFKVSKKPVVESPYIPPPEKNLFHYIGRTHRQLHQVT